MWPALVRLEPGCNSFLNGGVRGWPVQPLFLNMKKAFTLSEVIIVVIILGIIATLAIPRMTGMREQATAAEAFSALETLHAAEKRYELEHGTGVFTNNCALLDVDMAPKNFAAPVCAATGNVSMTRTGGTYTITKSIGTPSVFSCAGACAGLKLPN